MFFTRTQRYLSSLPKDELRNRLIGNHVKIHDLDFEIVENGSAITIIPHDEQVNAIKTLPFTKVELTDEGNKTKVSITFKMRSIDSGGPFLIVLFSAFLLIGSGVMMAANPKETTIIYALMGIGLFTITTFTIRMQTGYFDYVRKISAYVKSKGDHATAGINTPAMA